MPFTHISTTPSAPWQSLPVREQAGRRPNLALSGEQFQVVRGFGGCFNELGWAALSRLPAERQREVLRSLFDPTDGCAFTLGRIPIGASDYALDWYSLDEVDGDLDMRHFSIERDRRGLIPYIHAAQALQPGLRFFASPWSPPTWMKHPRAYASGKIRWEADILQAYALYLLRFVQAYRQEGIPVEQLHVQNEPDSAQVFPSCLWSGAELRDFIRDYLGPRFSQAGSDCQIWAGTLERPDYDHWAGVILGDPAARRYVSGVGYQWAGKDAVQRTRAAWPNLPILQTENECGDGRNTWEYAGYVFRLIQHYFSSGANGYMYWNMVLEPGGASTWGWKQNSMITADPRAGTVTYNPEFYVMKHLAHFVRPGAVRLGLRGELAAGALAFRNPSGQTVLLAANAQPSPRELTFGPGGDFSALLPPGSFNTIIWPG